VIALLEPVNLSVNTLALQPRYHWLSRTSTASCWRC